MSVSNKIGFNEIRDLNTETFEKIYNNPDQLAVIINKIASQVIDTFEPSQDVVQFYGSLVALNDTYNERFSTTPFQQAISKIDSAFKSKKTASLKKEVSASQSKSTHQILSKEEEFREKLDKLDLSSPKIGVEVQGLLSLLTQLEKQGRITTAQKEHLESALKSLIVTGSFKEKFFEIRAWHTICKLSPEFKTALEGAESLIKMTDKEGQRLVLKALKQPSLALDKLADTIPRQMKKIEKILIDERLDSIILKLPSNAQMFNSENFVSNFHSLINALQNFSHKIASPNFKNCWDNILSQHNEHNKGMFEKLLKYYPNIDLGQAMPKWVSYAEIEYISTLKLEDFFSDDLLTFNKKIIEMNESFYQNIQNFFADIYKEFLFDKHLWLADHCLAIKKPYNQAEDTNRNQGEGTCFQNSLERCTTLLTNPLKDGTKIEMGSTAKGRMLNAAVNQAASQAIQSKIPFEQILKIEAKTADKHGLVGELLHPKIKTTKVGEDIVLLIDKTLLTKQKDILWVFNLFLTRGGHAMNVQINPELGIFRFIDDNLGVCEWKTYKEFKEGFKNYLTAFYSDCESFSIETYKKK